VQERGLEALNRLSLQVDLDGLVDGLVATEEWANENVREPIGIANDSIMGMKRRLFRKVSEESIVFPIPSQTSTRSTAYPAHSSHCK